MNAGEVIKAKRLQANMTQAELAEKIGVIQNTVSKYEKGERTPRDSTKIAISKVLNTPVEDIFFGPKNTNCI